MPKIKFHRWIKSLDEDVVQGENGFEPGEFTIFADDWRPLYREGLSPREAWQRAMDAHKTAREAEDKAKAENYQRIKAADAAALR